MNLGDRVSANSGNTATTLVNVVDAYYSVEEDGYQTPMPVVHLTGCTEDGAWFHAEIEEFRPYFFVPAELLDQDRVNEIEIDRRVIDVRDAERDGLFGDDLVKIVCVKPWHVSDLREHFETTYEADVRFGQRFLIDQGIERLARVEDRALDGERVTPDAIEGVDADDVDVDIEPRTCYMDIEVREAPRDQPAVVSEAGCSLAKQPIIGLTAYDDTCDQYVTWTLRNEWDDSQFTILSEMDTAVDVDVRFCDDEYTMLADLLRWLLGLDDGEDGVDESPESAESDDSAFDVSSRSGETKSSTTEEVDDDGGRFNILTGWNFKAFDATYLVNRCLEVGLNEVKRLSPTGDVDEPSGDGSWINSDIKGLIVLDMLSAYQKTQFHSLKSKSLDYVAEKELDVGEGKLDVDEQEAWDEDPATFIDYSVRDVEAVVEIEQAGGIL